MNRRLLLALCIFISSQFPCGGTELLDLRLPPIKADGTLRDIGRELEKLGFRVCVEEVNLSSAPPIDDIHIHSEGASLRDLFHQLAQAHPDIGWEQTTFLMCPVIHLFRKSSVHDARNPLNLVLGHFSFNDADLTQIATLIYFNSEQFRNMVNPKGILWAYAGDDLRGVSMKPLSIRYSFDMAGWTLRELLDGLSCVSVNNGLSWYFSYDANKQFPDNFTIEKF